MREILGKYPENHTVRLIEYLNHPKDTAQSPSKKKKKKQKIAVGL